MRRGAILFQSQGSQVPEREPVEPGGQIGVLEDDREGQGHQIGHRRGPGRGDEEGVGFLPGEASGRQQDRLGHA